MKGLLVEPFYLKRKASRLRDWNLCTYHPSELLHKLEKKSISITRLKLEKIGLPMTTVHAFTWKEKHLDYEIETCYVYDLLKRGHNLEKKSISITRLKLERVIFLRFLFDTWKEKHLDYEIETRSYGFVYHSANTILKRKASRLRDWNWHFRFQTCYGVYLEKKSISITRLKLWQDLEINIDPYTLEKKSISITRLKPS